VPPNLAGIPAISRSFKVYDSTTKTSADARSFTFSLRPRDSTVTEFPSIPVSYFDVASEQYVTLRTEAVPLQVAEAERLSGAQLALGAGMSPVDAGLEGRQEGVFANITQPSAFVDQTVNPTQCIAGLVSLAGLYAAAAVVAARARRRHRDPSLVRRQRAAGRAQRRLSDAQSRAQDTLQAVDQQRAALVGLVADLADVPEAGITASDVHQHLEARDIPRELIDRFTRFLDTCDSARYGASSEALEGMDALAESLLADLLTACRQRKLLS
jgi:hypothetical protein